MNRRWSTCWLLSLALMLSIMGGSAVMGEKTKFYQATYQMDNVKGTLTVNGFPVTELTSGQGGSGSASLNLWLVGDNEMKASVYKADPSQTAGFSFGVSEMEQGDMVDTTDKGTMFSVEIKNENFDQAGKASAARSFKSSYDFSKTLKAGGEAKPADVLAYAQKFYGLFVKKDANGILRESAPKLADYSAVYGGVDMKAEIKNYLTTELFKAKLAKLNPAKLKAMAIGPTGRVWHILNGQAELIVASSSDGSTLEMPVFVAVVDGKLQVVR